MEQTTIDTILKISAAATGAILGWMAVLKPLIERRKRKKEQIKDAMQKTINEDRDYRTLVLEKLDGLETKLFQMDRSIADLQRDNIERAYCMFKMEHGYCTSGMKEAISDMYESYKARGYNHIAASRVAEIMALPEYPQRYEREGIKQ